MIWQPDLSEGGILLSTVRHGLTELNRDKRIGGLTDVPLIEEGRRQAREARQALDDAPFDVVVSSPLLRAIETAEIVTGVERAEIAIEEGCIERSFGEMEGLLASGVRERFPEVRYRRVGHVDYSLNPPGGESFEEMNERAGEFLDHLMRTQSGKRVALFAHENFLQQLHGVIRGLGPLDSLEQGILNCELNQFLLDGSGNPTSHRRVELCSSATNYPSF